MLTEGVLKITHIFEFYLQTFTTNVFQKYLNNTVCKMFNSKSLFLLSLISLSIAIQEKELINEKHVNCADDYQCEECFEILIENRISESCQLKNITDDIEVKDFCCETWISFECLTDNAYEFCNYTQAKGFEQHIHDLGGLYSQNTCKQYQFGTKSCESYSSSISIMHSNLIINSIVFIFINCFFLNSKFQFNN